MFDFLPEFIDPLQMVDKSRQFKGAMPLSKMPRLMSMLTNEEGEVRFDLRFEKQGRIAAIQGYVEAELVLQCQCCLEALPWQVKGEVHLGIVQSIDEASRLPEPFEPLLLENEEPILFADIIQDEVLLALPTIPQHEACGAHPADQEKSTGRKNPFAVLSNLKIN